MATETTTFCDYCGEKMEKGAKIPTVTAKLPGGEVNIGITIITDKPDVCLSCQRSALRQALNATATKRPRQPKTAATT